MSKIELRQDLLEYHSRYTGSARWRLTSEGLEIEGEGVLYSPGKPITVQRVWGDYSEPINAAAERFEIPVELIIATICTETRGRADALRKEPGYISDTKTPHKISPGIMQTLISTARYVVGAYHSLDGPGKGTNWRSWLLAAENSILVGTGYVATQVPRTALDPPLVAAAYNAGGLYYQGGENNRWRLRQYPIGSGEHVDRFVLWFNDAAKVLRDHPTRPAVEMIPR